MEAEGGGAGSAGGTAGAAVIGAFAGTTQFGEPSKPAGSRPASTA